MLAHEWMQEGPAAGQHKELLQTMSKMRASMKRKPLHAPGADGLEDAL